MMVKMHRRDVRRRGRQVLSFLLITAMVLGLLPQGTYAPAAPEAAAKAAENTYESGGCVITYKESSTWGNYVHAEVTIENQTSRDKSLWQLDIRYDGQIDNIWNADIILAEKGNWRVAAKSYNSTIPAGGSVSFGFLAYGEQEKPRKPSQISFVRKEAPTPSATLPAGGQEGTGYEIPERLKALEYALFASGKGGTDLYAGDVQIDGSIHTNGEFLFQGNKIQIKNVLEAGGGVVLRTSDAGDAQQIAALQEEAEPIRLPDITAEIYQYIKKNGRVHPGGKEFQKEQVSLDVPTAVEGELGLYATSFRGQGILYAKKSIQIHAGDAATPENTRLIIVSETGDITLNGTDIAMNAVLYAPNGTVRIHAGHFALDGRILAKQVNFNGNNLQIHAGSHDLDLLCGVGLFQEPEILREYDSAEEFGEEAAVFKGTEAAVGVLEAGQDSDREGLTLQNRKPAGPEKIDHTIHAGGFTVQETFTGGRKAGGEEDGGAWEGTLTLKLSQGKNSIENICIKKGHAYALSTEGLPWKQAEQACKEMGGHLAVIDDAEENEFLRRLVQSENGGEYTAIGYTDEANEGRWQWGNGSHSTYANWQSGEPNNGLTIFPSQDYAYMYASGTWDDGDGAGAYPYLCEWDEVKDISSIGGEKAVVRITFPEGVRVSGELPEQEDITWETEKNGDRTLLWSAAGETQTLEIPLETSLAGEAEALAKDITVFYREGNRLASQTLKDITLQEKEYREEGSWETVWDSGREGTAWNWLDVCATYPDDSSITWYAYASDHDIPEGISGDTLQEDLSGGQGGALSGLSGRYLYLKARLKSSSDGLSPFVDRVTVHGNTKRKKETTEKKYISEKIRGPEVAAAGEKQSYHFCTRKNFAGEPDTVWEVDGKKAESDKKDPSRLTVAFEKTGWHQIRACDSSVQGEGAVLTVYAEKEEPAGIEEIQEAFRYPVFDMALDKTAYTQGDTVRITTNIAAGNEIRAELDGKPCALETLWADPSLEHWDGSLRITDIPSGEHTIKITVQNAQKNTFSRETTFPVYASLPSVRTWFDKETYYQGEDVTLFLEKGYCVQECSLDGETGEEIPDREISDEASQVLFHKPSAGLHQITLVAGQPDGEKVSLRLYLYINDAPVVPEENEPEASEPDGPEPEKDTVPPETGINRVQLSGEGDLIYVILTAADDRQLAGYELSFGPEDGTEQEILAAGKDAVREEKAAVIRTEGLADGSYLIRLTAEDAAGNQSWCTYLLSYQKGTKKAEVEAAPEPEAAADTQAPEAAITRCGLNEAGDMLTVYATVRDNQGIKSYHLSYGAEGAEEKEAASGICAVEDTQIAALPVKDMESGRYFFTLREEDTTGNTRTVRAACNYTKGSSSGGNHTGEASVPPVDMESPESTEQIRDRNYPRASLAAPEAGQTLTDRVLVIGSAYDEEEMGFYRLEYRLKGEKDFTLLTESTEEKHSGVLGEWDTTLLMNGQYEIRLTVADASGNRNQLTRAVNVEGNLKIGNMHLGFTDITASLGGSTVNVNRYYDNRNKAAGDFGVGWTLGLQGMHLTESQTPLNEGYRLVSSGSLFNKGYEFVETAGHDVTVSYGDGTSDRFRLAFSPSRKALFPLYQTRLEYRCVTNPKVRLELTGENLAEITGEGLEFLDESLYGHPEYMLTTENGSKITLDAQNGVTKIEDASGNTITVDADGYHSENGKSITLERDHKNRVTLATDPAGNVTKYRYDEAGDLVSVTDAAGRTVSYAYDKKHNLKSITDPMGVAVARNEYDDDGRLTATVDADGNRMEYEHDVEGRIEVVTDRLGNKTVYVSDDYGNVLSITDANGKTTKSTYDSHGNVLTKTDAAGNVTAYTYDASSNMTTVTDADGNTLKNTYNSNNLITSINALGDTEILIDYDEKGNLTATTDAEGNKTDYAYDQNGNVTGITDGLGRVMSAKHDKEGNVIESIDSAGNKTTSTYDENGNRLTQTIYVVTENGTEERTTHYVYNAAGELIQTIDADGNSTSVERNDNGRMSAAIDSKGRRTEYEYDNRGNVTKIIYPDGTTEKFEYDAEDRNTKTVSRTGLVTTYVYDKVGNLLKQTDVRGNTVTYTYDSNYNLLTTTNAAGAVTSYTYDKLNRNTSITDAEGNVTSITYNAFSLQTSTTDARGNVTRYEYDNNGRRTKIIYPDGTDVESGYDERGRTIWQKDAEGRKTEYTYDGSDRLVSVKQPNGAVTGYTYDQKGNLTAVEDAEGNTTRYEYDPEGRRTKVILADGSSSSSKYDRNGMLTETVDYNQVKTTYQYDEQDRILREQTGSEYTDYEYDTYGRLAGVKTEDSEITYTYNRYGELEQKTYENGEAVRYLYDKYGRTSEIQVLYKDRVQASTGYEYDKMNRLTRVIGRNGEATVYTYDANGNRKTATFANGVKLTYTYDDLNRLKIQKAIDKNGIVIALYEYTREAGGQPVKVTETGDCGNVETSYDYDKANRLVRETVQTDTGKTVYEYCYDKAGNRISKGKDGVKTLYAYDSRNRLTTEKTENSEIVYHYDANGNLLRQSGGTDTIYTYDVHNRLVAYQQGEKKESYTYDAEGVRRSRTTGADSVYFVSDTSGSLSQTLAETDGRGAPSAEYTRADGLIAQTRDGEVSYYLYDGHGDVRALFNQAGGITDKYRYSAYGELIEKTGDTENHYLYTGEYYDGTSNLYYLRARYMNPSTGNFLTMDTYEGSIHDPDTLHKYLYANGNPATYSDPSGNCIAAIGLGQVQDSQINCTTYTTGMVLLNRALALKSVEKVLFLAVSYKVTKILCDYYISPDTDKSYNLNVVVTDVVVNVVWPWKKSKEEEKATAIDIAKDEQDVGRTYYHATSVESAALIVATGCLVGSAQEGGYIFAWTRIPDKKALNLSGARDAKVIVEFTTKANFVSDWGIDDMYVKSFGPVKSYFPGPIRIYNPIIIPVVNSMIGGNKCV